jgi:hypothetical protein
MHWTSIVLDLIKDRRKGVVHSSFAMPVTLMAKAE